MDFYNNNVTYAQAVIFKDLKLLLKQSLQCCFIKVKSCEHQHGASEQVKLGIQVCTHTSLTLLKQQNTGSSLV